MIERDVRCDAKLEEMVKLRGWREERLRENVQYTFIAGG